MRKEGRKGDEDTPSRPRQFEVRGRERERRGRDTCRNKGCEPLKRRRPLGRADMNGKMASLDAKGLKTMVLVGYLKGLQKCEQGHISNSKKDCSKNSSSSKSSSCSVLPPTTTKATTVAGTGEAQQLQCEQRCKELACKIQVRPGKTKHQRDSKRA